MEGDSFENDLPPDLRASRKSGTGGTGAKVAAFGCGCLGLVLALAIVGGFYSFRSVKGLLDETAQFSALEMAWNPPAADAPLGDLFPETVAGWGRLPSVEQNLVPIDPLGGTEAPMVTYSPPHSGADVRCWTLRETDLDWNAVGSDLETWVKGHSSHTRVDLGERKSFSVNSPPRSGLFWKVQGEAFYLETDETGARAELQDFAAELLKANSAPEQVPLEIE